LRYLRPENNEIWYRFRHVDSRTEAIKICDHAVYLSRFSIMSGCFLSSIDRVGLNFEHDNHDVSFFVRFTNIARVTRSPGRKMRLSSSKNGKTIYSVRITMIYPSLVCAALYFSPPPTPSLRMFILSFNMQFRFICTRNSRCYVPNAKFSLIQNRMFPFKCI